MPKNINNFSNEITTRSSLDFQVKTFRESDDSVEFVLATEEPAEIFDIKKWRVVKETLVASGAEFPKNRQIPLLNCHNRFGIENILGSVRDFRIENNQLVGRLYFSKQEEAQKALQMIKEGHLDSGSVGYFQRDSVWIEKGESLVHEGRTFHGPLYLTKKWHLQEFSLVPIGADPNAKARSNSSQINNGINSPSTVENNFNSEGDNVMPEKQNIIGNSAENDATENTPALRTRANPPKASVDEAQIARNAVEAERARIAHITSLCDKHKCRNMADELIRSGASVEQVNEKILLELEKRSMPIANAAPTISMGATANEKFRAVAVDGILLRSGIEVEKPTPGAEELRGFGYRAIAREVLRINGNNQMLSDQAAIELVMRAGSQAYDDFAYILDNGSKKAMLKGYKEAVSTWKAFANVGSLGNLEPVTRVGTNDIAELEKTTEGAEIGNTIISDKGEVIKLDTYARSITLTRRAILADDFGFFSNIAKKFGARAAQKVEKLAYSVLTANSPMSDNVKLFHETHKNLGSIGALSKETLGAAFALMRKQKDANGSMLDLMPKILLVSPDEAMVAEVLTTSTSDVDTNIAFGNTNFFRNQGLIAISSPYIDENSNGFYLIADPKLYDTIEVAFLNGNESPVIYSVDNAKDILSRKWVCYLDIAAKAMDYRTMVRVPHS